MVDQPKTPEDVKQYLRTYCTIDQPLTINSDLTVSTNFTVWQKLRSRQIPIKFKSLRAFVSDRKDLRDLSCLPDEPFAHISITYYKNVALLRCLNAKEIELRPISWDDQNMWARYYSAQRIMTKYQGQGQAGAMACAAELAQAGLKENARW
jgi:hypothetical protein